MADDLHPMFKKDPEEWMQYVYKQVSVLSDDGIEHSGWVYTVDPVSESFVLVSFADGEPRVNIVVGSAVTNITIINEDIQTHRRMLDGLFRPDMFPEMTADKLKKKQMFLKMWLDKNRLPVEIGGPGDTQLTVSDALVIEPPYEAENCQSTNEIILGRIQGLIKNMPQNHDEW